MSEDLIKKFYMEYDKMLSTLSSGSNKRGVTIIAGTIAKLNELLIILEQIIGSGKLNELSYYEIYITLYLSDYVIKDWSKGGYNKYSDKEAGLLKEVYDRIKDLTELKERIASR